MAALFRDNFGDKYLFMRSNDSSLKGKIFLFYLVSSNNLYKKFY